MFQVYSYVVVDRIAVVSGIHLMILVLVSTQSYICTIVYHHHTQVVYATCPIHTRDLHNYGIEPWSIVVCGVHVLGHCSLCICDRFEQHVHFSKDRTMEHSQWKAAEFSQELLLVPVPVFNRH